MSSEQAEYYNRLYTRQPKVFGIPDPLVSQALTYLAPERGIVLDIGAGHGRHALFFAERGFSVDAVDESKKGIAIIRAVAEKRHLPITARVADISAEKITGLYQAIICTFVLHELLEDQGSKLLVDMQEHTAAGGLNIIAAWVADPQYQKAFDFQRCFLSPHELSNFWYDGWKIIADEEKTGRLTVRKSRWQVEQTCAYLIARKMF